MQLTLWVYSGEMVETTHGTLTAKGWCYSECKRIAQSGRKPKIRQRINKSGQVRYCIIDDSVKMVRMGAENTPTLVRKDSTPERKPHGKKWTPAEFDKLKELYLSGMITSKCAEAIGRSVGSCTGKLNDNGLLRKRGYRHGF